MDLSRSTISVATGEFRPESYQIFLVLGFVFALWGLTSAPVHAASLMVGSGQSKTLPDNTCGNDICHFDSVVVKSGGTLFINGQTNGNKGVTINTPYFEVELGGKVDGIGRGYKSGEGPQAGGNAGPGSIGSGGGGYGGKGGDGTSLQGNIGPKGGSFDDSAFYPTRLGSGAGSVVRDLRNAQRKGEGGAGINIQTQNGEVIINGEINMSGNNGQRTMFGIGGGAGGSISSADTVNAAGGEWRRCV